MKNKNKCLFAIIALFAVILSLTAHAQGYVTVATSPATLATTVTTNLASPPVIECDRQQNVALVFSFNQSGASTSNVVYTLERSVDRSNWDTATTYVFSIPSTGTTRVNYGTNINVGAFRYLRVKTIANSTALTTMTNYGVSYAIKANAP